MRIVDTLLRHAIAQNASDIHIEPLEDTLLMRYRIDGILHDAMRCPKHAAAGIIARIKVLANMRLDENRLPQDGRFGRRRQASEFLSASRSCRRTSARRSSCAFCARRCRASRSRARLPRRRRSSACTTRCSKTTGMILISGPTGGGKSTTLYTMLDIVNTPDVNISTIEDPIEYQMKRVNQTQVRPEIGFTFANGLRSLVRQDPDIIMVGEIRDKETAIARHQRGAHRPPRALDHPHQLRGGRHPAPPRHGRRAVPPRLDASRHHRPAPRAQARRR